MSANASRLGPGGQPLTVGVLPPGVFDPKVDNCDWYTYQVDLGNSPLPNGAGANLAAGATASALFAVDRDTDFYLTDVHGFAIDTTGAAYNGNGIQASAQIYDSGTVRQVMSAAIPVGTLCGTAEKPATMILPRLFRSLSTITVTVTSNFSSVTLKHLWLTFVGYRIFLGG